MRASPVSLGIDINAIRFHYVTATFSMGRLHITSSTDNAQSFETR
jgi:hypothetical protein